jgi:hypothetical protein
MIDDQRPDVNSGAEAGGASGYEGQTPMAAFLAGRDPRMLALAIFFGILFFTVLCVGFIYLLTGDDDGDGSRQPTAVAATVAANEGVLVEAVSESGTISITLQSPAFLNVANSQFNVESEIVPASGVWTPDLRDDTSSRWVYGTVINYVFGLADVRANRQLLEGLMLGDEIVVTTGSGSTSTFAFSSRELVASSNTDIMAQHAPGITIILIDRNPDAQRLVVRGRFTGSDSEVASQPGQVISLGETTQLENLQLTASGVAFLLDRPEVPPGFAFYLVDYQVHNVGSQAVDSGFLNMVLVDDLGNVYAMNPVASQLGSYRLLSGTVGPGQTIAATAGYQIPAALNSPMLMWQVSRRDTGSKVEVEIPFRDTAASGQPAVISLEQAEVSLDGTSVLLSGFITNLGNQPLVINSTDIALSSDGGVFLMLSTNPAFPWVLEPGQQGSYSVTFQRPPGATAIFKILNQAFQLTGLH